MSKCDIWIELDGAADRVYTPGDLLTGTAHVRAHQDFECKALLVGCLWKTHGRGTNRQGTPQEHRLFAGSWTEGSDYSYPFELVVPNGPNTYHGHLLNIDWYARARVDVAWAIDPSAEADFLLGPGPKSDPATYINNDSRATTVARVTNEDTTGCAGCMLGMSILIFAGGSVMLFSRGIVAQRGPYLYGLVGVIVGIIALSAIVVAVRKWVSRRILGTVELFMPAEPVLVGARIPVEVHLSAHAREKINAATATLICMEDVSYGSGTNRSNESRTLFRQEFPLTEQTDKGGDLMVLGGAAELPVDAPPSVKVTDNELFWRVDVYVDVANCPDWHRQCFLDVRPAPVRTSQAAEPAGVGPAW